MFSQPCQAIMVVQEFGDEAIEIPIEKQDGTVLLDTLSSNFPNAIGELKKLCFFSSKEANLSAYIESLLLNRTKIP